MKGYTASRVRETNLTFIARIRHEKTMPVPTVSQGIAVYPDEAANIMGLIRLADRRLYIAKERGRNKIEPDSARWEMIKMHREG